jgi:hypothetical protein
MAKEKNTPSLEEVAVFAAGRRTNLPLLKSGFFSWWTDAPNVLQKTFFP